MNAPAAIGHNVPPDPAEAFSLHLADLEEQAQHFLDGEPVETREQAEAVSRLLGMVRKASNDADEARKAEKKPHDEAGKAVQEKWKPIFVKADLIASTAKQVLAPWLTKLEREQRAAAEAERQEAERLAAAAREALEKAGTSLSARIGAEALVKAAGKADKAAKRAEGAKAHATGGERAVTLRPVWTPTLTDPVAALKHYRETQPCALKEWLLEQALKDVRGGKRSIPGFTVTESKVAV
jgi:hypothetical protein